MTDKLLKFAKPADSVMEKSATLAKPPWEVLVVDDDQTIHDVTKLVLSHYEFDGASIQLTHAYSAQQAQSILESENSFAVLLLDVVMETDHAGLDLVNYIRRVLNNQFIRIVLRTGQPGQAPELNAITDYDINDYREKSELTADKMRACLTSALRSYQDLTRIHELVKQQQKLEKSVQLRNDELESMNLKLRSEMAQKKAAEDELVLTNLRLNSIINNSSALISLKNLDGVYDLVNHAFLENLSLKTRDIVGKTDRDIFDSDTATMIAFNDRSVIDSQKPMQCEEIYPTKDSEHFYLCSKFPLFDSSGVLYKVCCIATDITDRLEAQNEILHLAQYDSLTDLPNRSLFIDRLYQATSRQEWHTHHIAILFIDLDRFKNVNDTLGHDVGDKLLVQVAKRIKAALRPGDSIARFGGDEFAVLLNDLSSEKDIARVAHKIMDAVSAHYIIDNRELVITPSIGISRSPLDGNDVQVLLKKADFAMYKAKKSGKNTYRFYLQEDDSRANEQLTIEVELRKALSKNEFFLVYQPKINIKDGTMTGVEALLRWQHPTKGLISPGHFIPVLEETGLIVDVGHWVLREACRFAARQAAGGVPMQVAVNLSPHQFRQGDLLQVVQDILADTGCQPALLELEVTEGSLVQDMQRTKAVLTQLSEMGISLAIDDFGTGYSSLNYLKCLPFNTLKIDRSFIVDAPSDPQDRAIVTTIAQLAHNLGMKVVAEGVETCEQYNLVCNIVSTLDLGQVQGFFFSKPRQAQSLGHCTEEIQQIWQTTH